MSAYVIAEIEVTDPAAYEDYRRQVPAVVEKYQGKFIVRGGRIESMEGGWSPKRMVVVEFPSMDQAVVHRQTSAHARRRRRRPSLASPTGRAPAWWDSSQDSRGRPYATTSPSTTCCPGCSTRTRRRRTSAACSSRPAKSFEGLWEERGRSNPAGRYGRVRRSAPTAHFLCSAHAGCITAQNLLIDGGAYPGTF
jgi:uncharacterized protein (DUF1330 family)